MMKVIITFFLLTIIFYNLAPPKNIEGLTKAEKAALEAKRKAEAKRRAEEEARRKAEAKRRAEEEAKRRAEARRKAELEARWKRDAERKEKERKEKENLERMAVLEKESAKNKADAEAKAKEESALKKCRYTDHGAVPKTSSELNQDNNKPPLQRGAPSKYHRSNQACEQATIYENNERLEEAEEKLNELQRIFAKTKLAAATNNKNIHRNSINVIKLQDAICSSSSCNSSGSDSACDAHPEACPGNQVQSKRASEKIAAVRSAQDNDYGYKPYHN